MKVPEYIKIKMRKVVELQNKSSKLMDEIEEWMELKGIDTGFDGLRDGSGIGLEELDYGNDCVEDLCERLEKEK